MIELVKAVLSGSVTISIFLLCLTAPEQEKTERVLVHAASAAMLIAAWYYFLR